MLTIFSTPKPFVGHIAVIQRNALESWRRLDADVEIILLGDDAGTAEVCRELGLRHEAHVERKEGGTKSVRSIFGRAQELARHAHMCYCNCDIILMADFAEAFRKVRAQFEKFLMVGRRWDVDVAHAVDFAKASWENDVAGSARRDGFQRLHYNIDYFVFHRGLYREFPDLVIGRNWWDQWLIWQAGAAGVPVVDASDVVCAVHQNHDYSYHPRGMEGVWNDDRTRANFRAAGGCSRLHTIEDANWRLTASGLKANRWWRAAPARRALRRLVRGMRTLVRTRMWHPLLDLTRPMRSALGLRENALGWLKRRPPERRHWLDK
jgi:hypothetical protein